MLGSYLEHICDGLGSAVADFVPLKVELFDGGVFLSEVERKDTVSGGVLTGIKTHGKQCAGQGSLRKVVLGSVWVKILIMCVAQLTFKVFTKACKSVGLLPR